MDTTWDIALREIKKQYDFADKAKTRLKDNIDLLIELPYLLGKMGFTLDRDTAVQLSVAARNYNWTNVRSILFDVADSLMSVCKSDKNSGIHRILKEIINDCGVAIAPTDFLSHYGKLGSISCGGNQ